MRAWERWPAFCITSCQWPFSCLPLCVNRAQRRKRRKSGRTLSNRLIYVFSSQCGSPSKLALFAVSYDHLPRERHSIERKAPSQNALLTRTRCACVALGEALQHPLHLSFAAAGPRDSTAHGPSELFIMSVTWHEGAPAPDAQCMCRCTYRSHAMLQVLTHRFWTIIFNQDSTSISLGCPVFVDYYWC